MKGINKKIINWWICVKQGNEFEVLKEPIEDNKIISKIVKNVVLNEGNKYESNEFVWNKVNKVKTWKDNYGYRNCVNYIRYRERHSKFSLNYLKNSGGLRRELKWQNFYFQRFQIFFCADLSVRSLL